MFKIIYETISKCNFLNLSRVYVDLDVVRLRKLIDSDSECYVVGYFQKINYSNQTEILVKLSKALDISKSSLE